MSYIQKSFLELGLDEHFSKTLYEIGYKIPFPIQIKCIPKLINGNDILGIAQTGSGKSAAFILPFLYKVNLEKKLPQTLIIAPTRELVIQISKVLFNFSVKLKKINITSLYGGQNYDLQFKSLKNNPHIVIGTPGRILDHINRNTLILSEINSLVIDEADEMLKMGFIEDVKKILLSIKSKYQIALFSATMPNEIKKIASNFMNNLIEVNINNSNDNNPNIKQNFYLINKFNDKNESLLRFLEYINYNLCIIFIRTKDSTIEISNLLNKYNYNCLPLNGDLNQKVREKTINLFKNKKIDILVATDIASRGLDVKNVDLIINYDAPYDLNTYIHRIGRTGRAGNYGKSIIFIKKNELYILKKIQNHYSNLNPIEKCSLPTNKFISEIRFNKIIDLVKDLYLNNDYIKYNLYIDKLLVHVDNDIKKLSLILFKIIQIKKPLFFEKILLNEDFKINDNTSLDNNIKFKNKFNIIKINIGSKDNINIKNIINILKIKCDINYKLIGNIKIFDEYSEIKIINKFNFIDFSKKISKVNWKNKLIKLL